MKKFLNIIFPVLVVLGMSGCDTAGGIDSAIFSNATNGALASWITKPDAKKLILSDPTATAKYEIEFIDEKDGSSIEAFTLTVSQTKFRGKASGTLISQSTFSANSNGNQGFSGTFSLNSIATALGVEITALNEKDTLSFSSTITRGGIVYPSGAASTFLDAVQDMDLNIPLETVSISSFSVKNEVVNSSAQKVTMAFKNDFGISLKTLPTVARTSAAGATDDVLGEVMAVKDKKKKDSVYIFNYTPSPTELRDTVSFTVSGASAFSTGFVMKNKSYNDVFIVDNIKPTTSGDNSAVVLNDKGNRIGYRFHLLFSENIGSVTLTSNFVAKDDDGDDDTAIATDSAKETVTFTGAVFDHIFGWVSKDGEVILTLTVKDIAGNTLDTGAISVRLTP